jgi:hypothetical protein
MTWPAILLWLLIIAATFSRGPSLLYVFGATASFGTLQMVPGDAVGDVTLLPQSVCAACLVGKILVGRGNLARALMVAVDPARLGPLFLFLAYGILSAYAMPRLFMNMVEVVPVRLVASTERIDSPALLQPTGANFTQSAYLTLSIGIVLAFTLRGGQPDFQRHYLQAMLLSGAVLIATGLIDLFMGNAGLSDLLEPFRNASYSFLVDVSILDLKRVVGFMPEASYYGAACVGAAVSLAFLRPFFEPGLRNTLVPATVLGLIVMAALSTSSTAYVGLSIFAVVFAINWLRRFLNPHALARVGLYGEAFVVIAAALGLLLIIVLSPALLDPINAVLDEIVFHKDESYSYLQRSDWNSVGMRAFFATQGVGVGLGSTRTSNWCIAILSNTGIIGATLLASFIVRLFLERCRNGPCAAEFVMALKLSLLPGFVMAVLAGTTPDIGLGPGAILGLIASLTFYKSAVGVA